VIRWNSLNTASVGACIVMLIL